MDRDKDLNFILRDIQQLLAEQELRLQTCVRQHQNIRLGVSSLVGSPISEDVILEPITLRQIAIANGRLLSPEKMRNINKDDYDVILDCVNRTLLARKDPDRRSKLEKCDCTGIGRDRLKLLRSWLENPHLLICEETIPQIFGDIASMTPNALARAILDLRGCLWNGPYILTESVWGESISRTGSVYILSQKYKYLVIRYKI
jgi:hypothetical protein